MNAASKSMPIAEALAKADQHADTHGDVPSVSRTLAAEVRRLTERVAELERANGVSESEFIARLRALNLPVIAGLDRLGKFDFHDFPKHLKKDAYSRVGLYPVTRYCPEPPK